MMAQNGGKNATLLIVKIVYNRIVKCRKDKSLKNKVGLEMCW